MAAALARLDYRRLKRPDRAWVRHYLQRLGGFSRTQITRAVPR